MFTDGWKITLQPMWLCVSICVFRALPRLPVQNILKQEVKTDPLKFW